MFPPDLVVRGKKLRKMVSLARMAPEWKGTYTEAVGKLPEGLIPC